jgi:S1-C subfamily serine protease
MNKKKHMITIMITIALISLLIFDTTLAYDQTVYDVQKKLKELGYEPGPTDGIWGRQTEVAVKIFQQDYGLPVTGRLTKKTLRTLGITEFATESAPSINKRISSSEVNLIELVENIQPAVVTVITYDKNKKASGLGSGFFVDKVGHLITNYHVLRGKYFAEVQLHNGKKYSIKSVVAENNAADLIKALVDIAGGTPKWVKLTKNLPKIAERIFVIGTPKGLEQTVTEGIVSAVREMPNIGEMIQISAPISPGSSGSPVINMKGEVIGVATLFLIGGQNLNFAAPSTEIIALERQKIGKTIFAWTSGKLEMADKWLKRGKSLVSCQLSIVG